MIFCMLQFAVYNKFFLCLILAFENWFTPSPVLTWQIVISQVVGESFFTCFFFLIGIWLSLSDEVNEIIFFFYWKSIPVSVISQNLSPVYRIGPEKSPKLTKINVLPPNNLAVFDCCYFLCYWLQKGKLAQTAHINHLFQFFNLIVKIYATEMDFNTFHVFAKKEKFCCLCTYKPTNMCKKVKFSLKETST